MSMPEASEHQFPFIVGVGGLTSEVGKTALICELLKAFPGWEAIKTTRGHYRSCGKDPQACCVSHLLKDEPVVMSGRELTYSPGKDTGRYWDAGAKNVHWVIATDDQVSKGIHEAIKRVHTRGVFVEGNSFARYIKPDVFVMAARSDSLKSKPSAREVLDRVSGFYFSDTTKPIDVDALNTRLSEARVTNSESARRFSALDLNEIISRIHEASEEFLKRNSKPENLDSHLIFA
uniref:Uncharacterized protein n=1 Tax=uncultured Acidobacteriota bacterium TaxID=171953 RepID=Q7X317_9BACT|nr:hypothetical protein [uncultured Acidobacteriota bacterium]